MYHFILVCCRSWVRCEKSSAANSQELIQDIINLLQDEIFDIEYKQRFETVLKICTRFSFLPFLPEGSILLPFFQVNTSMRRARIWPQCGLSFPLPAWPVPVICIFAILTVSPCPPLQATTDPRGISEDEVLPNSEVGAWSSPFKTGIAHFYPWGLFPSPERKYLVSQLISKIMHSLTCLHGKKVLTACSFKGFGS